MSGDLVRSIGALAAETAVEVAWAQWGALTPTAAGVSDHPRVSSIVDPEALILLSLAVRDHERRLTDLLAGFALRGSSLISIQRLKTLAKDHPEAVRERIPDFGRYGLDAGDRRWRTHAADPAAAVGSAPRAKDFGPLRLTAGPALMLRLRAGMGVGAKADLLTFLLGRQGSAAELKTIALATGYSNRAVRTAAEEMALARLIQEVEGTPASYRADPKAWRSVLAIQQPDGRPASDPRAPLWRFWSVVFSFLTTVVDWHREAKAAEWSGYVASSRARDLMETHRRRLRYTGVALPSAADATGAAYLESFGTIVAQVCGWSRESLGGIAKRQA